MVRGGDCLALARPARRMRAPGVSDPGMDPWFVVRDPELDAIAEVSRDCLGVLRERLCGPPRRPAAQILEGLRLVRHHRVLLPGDVAEYIARAIKSNIRELEGALIRLMAYASLTGVEINLQTAQQVLKNIIDTQDKKVTIEQIQKRVGEHFGLRAQDLKVRSNAKVITFPRQVAMFLVKQLTTASLPEIGKQFGGKHHTTVLHSINKIELLRQTDKDLNKAINRLLDSFG